jgi:sterol desaturase/sphingolipid hydroxylase (fatty acid hydroxylase superfamily)
LLHATPWLWRFHAVHHADPDLDISTSYRFHFVEVGLSSGFRALQVLCIGASVSQLVAYALTYQLASMFHHSNISLPAWLDRALSVLVITPRLHGIHHSQQRAHANSNYAVVLSVWDWIHGTRIATADQASLRIGVAGVDGPLDNGLLRALFAPFRRQPSYWRETLPRS